MNRQLSLYWKTFPHTNVQFLFSFYLVLSIHSVMINCWLNLACITWSRQGYPADCLTVLSQYFSVNAFSAWFFILKQNTSFLSRLEQSVYTHWKSVISWLNELSPLSETDVTIGNEYSLKWKYWTLLVKPHYHYKKTIFFKATKEEQYHPLSHLC